MIPLPCYPWYPHQRVLCHQGPNGAAPPPGDAAGALRFSPHLQLRIERSFRHRDLQDAKRRLVRKCRKLMGLEVSKWGTGVPQSLADLSRVILHDVDDLKVSIRAYEDMMTCEESYETWGIQPSDHFQAGYPNLIYLGLHRQERPIFWMVKPS